MSLPQYLIPGVVAVIVVFLALAFFVWYWRPSRYLRRTPKSLISAIQALKPSADTGSADRDQVGIILESDPTLAHLWKLSSRQNNSAFHLIQKALRSSHLRPDTGY